MRAGSVLGFAGSGVLSGFINVVTLGIPHRNLSHVGIVARCRGRLRLFESNLETGVTCGSIGQKIARYLGRCYHYELSRPLYDFEDDRLSEFLLSLVGRPYDPIGAMRSAGWLVAKSKAASTKPNLSSLFCSELVAAAHNHIGLYPTANSSRFSPNSLVRYERCAGILAAPVRLK